MISQSGQLLQDTFFARYGHDIEWFSCTRRVMYDNNHGNVQQVFPVSTQTTVLTNQKHNIKIQSVQLNHSVLSTILLWQS